MVLTYLWTRVDVPKIGQKPPLPREDAPEAPVGRVAVPKSGQKPPLPREDAPEVLVGEVAVPKVVPRVQLKKRYWMQGVFWRKA